MALLFLQKVDSQGTLKQQEFHTESNPEKVKCHRSHWFRCIALKFIDFKQDWRRLNFIRIALWGYSPGFSITRCNCSTSTNRSGKPNEQQQQHHKTSHSHLPSLCHVGKQNWIAWLRPRKFQWTPRTDFESHTQAGALAAAQPTTSTLDIKHRNMLGRK